MIDKRLVEAVPGAERLKSAMITPDLFVKDLMQDYSGRPLYTYEEWTRELINHSNAFKELTRGAEFHAPVSEANGECDAVSDAYQLDFKLIFGESMMRAVSLTSSRRVSDRGITLELLDRTPHFTMTSGTCSTSDGYTIPTRTPSFHIFAMAAWLSQERAGTA